MDIDELASTVLLKMATYLKPGDSETYKGHYEFEGPELAKLVGASPRELNDAIAILDQNDYVEVLRFLGTAPFAFGSASLTARGRVEAQRAARSVLKPPVAATPSASPAQPNPAPTVALARSPLPVGSPYGFTDQDWEYVESDRSDVSRLIVVFGHQWDSNHYSRDHLRTNVKSIFETALASLVAQSTVSLDFKPLAGGYGQHLFNEIARCIIGADIAVFDTSDLNPNVMIEMGVALTWGVRVLPIREASAPKPPSDISGQTWAEYTTNAAVWSDPDHTRKLAEMVKRALRKKGVAVP